MSTLDLPHPLVPTIVTNSPSAMSASKPSTATNEPALPGYEICSCSKVMCPIAIRSARCGQESGVEPFLVRDPGFEELALQAHVPERVHRLGRRHASVGIELIDPLAHAGLGVVD